MGSSSDRIEDEKTNFYNNGIAIDYFFGSTAFNQ